MPSARIASFDYRGIVCTLDLVSCDPPRLAFTCPVCGRRAAINPRRHEAIVNLKTGTVTIRPTVICPNRICGWAAIVADGRAVDVEEPRGSPATVRVLRSHPERDRVCACGQRFRSKTYTVASDGRCESTIGGLEVHSEGRCVDDPFERRLAFSLMLFGRWGIVDRPANIENGKLLSWDFVLAPEELAADRPFQFIGPMSSLLSNEFNALTRSETGVERQTPDREPGALGVRIPENYVGKQLRLWRFRVYPKWWKEQAS